MFEAEPPRKEKGAMTGSRLRQLGAARRQAEQSRLERVRARPAERQERAVAEALAGERRRVAAEVHDLVMQDLALALATARQLAEGGEERLARTIVEAGERAMRGARELIAGLAAADGRSLAEALEASVREAAGPVPVRVAVDAAAREQRPDGETFAALLHVGREAVRNAVKHGHPQRIEVALERAEEWVLRVRDDGAGFDPATTEAGFGLASMRAQARALQGRLELTSAPGAGTIVEAVLP
jgi:signal transduction histidine kinase